jgi:hypothetical protein
MFLYSSQMSLLYLDSGHASVDFMGHAEMPGHQDDVNRRAVK